MRLKKFWIGVESKEHVENGIKLGICQFCHGKSAPAKLLSKGDIVIYYSSKYQMHSTEVCQQFTAIGIVQDDKIYQVEIDQVSFKIIAKAMLSDVLAKKLLEKTK